MASLHGSVLLLFRERESLHDSFSTFGSGEVLRLLCGTHKFCSLAIPVWPPPR